MASVDNEISETMTASSSGIENSDVAILAHESLQSFVGEIESNLEARQYTVSKPLCAGRQRVENLASQVHHAMAIIVFLTNETASTFQSLLQTLKPGALSIPNTLIFYRAGVNKRSIKRSLAIISRIKVHESTTKIADLIDIYLRLHKRFSSAKYHNGIDVYDVRKQFIDLLIHSIMNPQLEKAAAEMEIGKCKKEFSKQYGNFLSCEVGKFEKYVKGRDGFHISKDLLGQTSSGLQMAINWLHPTLVDVSTNEPELAVSFPEKNGSTQRRTFYSQLSSEHANKKPLKTFAETLSKHFGEFDSRFAFFLITSRLSSSRFLSGISNVPWLRVFDFDSSSRENGLLVSIENLIKKKRSFTISTAKDSSQALSERATDWFFPMGFSDKPDTILECHPYQWYCKNKQMLEQQGEDIAGFCSCRYLPVFLILWYDFADDNIICLDWFLSVLLPYFATNPVCKILLCVEELAQEHSNLMQLIKKYQLDSSVLIVPLKNVCDWLSYAKVSFTPRTNGIKLPKAASDDDPAGVVEISEELKWIQQYIEILPLRNMQDNELSESKDIGKDFVRGGIVTWADLVYRKAIERKNQAKVLEYLTKNIKSDVKQIVTFKIFHTPGGGGTTFARQLLWFLHTEAPCGVVIPHPTFSVTPLLERVNLLYERCQLPIILLVDGRSDYEVQQLYENCKHFIVILHVQRCNHVLPQSPCNPALNHHYLPGHLANEEADKLVDILSEFAPKNHDALQALAKDCNYDAKLLFEFGLTAFNSEFKGVQTYVRGYLDLHHNSFTNIEKLQPWQKVVAYLSLVLYYGQGALPREVFNNLLKDDLYNSVSLYDVEYAGRQFLVEFNREWKINYYAVAKEILEQILSISSGGSSYGNKDRLSHAAQLNLHELVIDFIGMLKTAMGSNISEYILKQLSNVILRRDYKELDDGDVFEKRHTFSRLLEDVKQDEDRIQILECLTNAFPFHHEFHAHKGRMLNMMGKYDEAEAALQTALNLRIKERSSRAQAWPDNVRGRLHHMFGFACRRRANHELGNRQSPYLKPDLPKIMKIIQNAVHHFNEGRKYSIYNRSYGYIGEVRVRLLIAEHVSKSKDEFPEGCLEAFNGTMDQKCIQLSVFLRESHSVCDQLLAECQRYTSEAELKGVKDFYVCVEKFVMCFQKVYGCQDVWQKCEGNMSTRRSRIASLKMRYFRKDFQRTPSVDDIDNVKDIKQLVELHEETFRFVIGNSVRGVSISFDVLEWLEAVRHRKISDDYSLVKVLQTVETWEKRNEVGYATYYLYILYFLLAVYSPGQKMSSNYYFKADELKKKLKTTKHRLINMRLTREWLASHEQLTIRKLVCRSKLGSWDYETRFWKDPELVEKLQVCTGIIIKSSHKRDGYIKLDVPNRKLKVEISYYPAFYNLFGNRYSEQSIPVEFFIGFSVERGAEALSVKKLHQSFCSHCELNTKVITLNEVGPGICCKCENAVEDGSSSA